MIPLKKTPACLALATLTIGSLAACGSPSNQAETLTSDQVSAAAEQITKPIDPNQEYSAVVGSVENQQDAESAVEGLRSIFTEASGHSLEDIRVSNSILVMGWNDVLMNAPDEMKRTVSPYGARTPWFEAVRNNPDSNLNYSGLEDIYTKALLLGDKLHYSPEMSADSKLTAQYMWSEQLRYTFGGSESLERDMGQRVVLAEPFITANQVISASSDRVELSGFYSKAVSDTGEKLGIVDDPWGRITLIKVDGVWKIDAQTLADEGDSGLAGREQYKDYRVEGATIVDGQGQKVKDLQLLSQIE